MDKDKIYQGDSLEVLKTFQDECCQMCVTSPPYYGLRDYGVDGQIGLEETPEAYVEKLVEVFREVKRVLKDDGVLWLNLGDSYAGSHGNGNYPQTNTGMNSESAGFVKYESPTKDVPGIKSKDLIGIPWMVAFALRKDGWYLRSDIIWNKPNPMPESVTDRPTKAHEYIFLMSKSQKYFYDAEEIAEDSVDEESYSGRRYSGRRFRGPKTIFLRNGYAPKMNAQTFDKGGPEITGKTYGKRNKRDVWTVTTKPYKEAHFATFPPDLIEPCILAGSRPGDVVLDPFFGSGTTGEVAQEKGRHWVGIELNPAYVELATKRINAARVPLFV